MLPSTVHVWFWISFTLTFLGVSLILLPVDGLLEDDYEFGWFTTGVLDPGQLPTCTYCINALGDASFTDQAHRADWNRTVGLYRCDGAQTNEIWGYDNSNKSIVFSRLSEKLCLDALLWESSVLKLRECNSSVVTQQWTYEDHRLINGLIDSNGQPFYLLAAPPDLGTNPSSQDYTYPLLISSSTPESDQMSYTSNFSFVPTTNLVVRSTDTFTTAGLLQISYSRDSEGQISNGGFETSTILSGPNIAASAWNQTFPSYFSFCGWVIDYGPIDYVNSGFLPGPTQGGRHSIHLNTHTDLEHSGSISQTFRTEVGKEYVLSFYMTGFPPVLLIPERKDWACNNPTYLEGGARLQLQVTNATTRDTSSGLLSNGSDVTQNFTANVTTDLDARTIEASWTQKIVNFKASTNVTTISFRSLNFNDSCGPMIDMVEVSLLKKVSKGINKVVPVAVGAIGALAGLLAILAIVYGIKGCREREYNARLYKTEHARLYSIQELRTATKKFSSILGEGGFGTVYKAEFPDGTVGAVKVEKPRGPNSSSKVLASDEIAVLLRVHHRNLVNLIGFCIHKGRHMLVFEYLPNGSLFGRLHQSVLPSPPEKSVDCIELGYNTISWKQRVKIATDVACGLEYLHHDADPPIVHRDVKSQNILLTTTNFAKLADFGLSKAAPVDATSFQSIETVVKGSIGYLDPQYFFTGVFSPKSDVYSFGVVLLELISGHQAIYNAGSLFSWAAPFLENPSLYHELVDTRLNGDFNADELETLVDLCKMCMQEDGKMRPNMRQVVSFLNSKQLSGIVDESAKWTADEDAASKESYRKIYEAMMFSYPADEYSQCPRDSDPIMFTYADSHPRDSSPDSSSGDSLSTT